MSIETKLIELVEHKPRPLLSSELTQDTGETLWKRYAKQVSVDPPSFQNDHCWVLTNLGWAGYIPLTENTGVVLKPKVPIRNIFSMLEYAYRLRFQTEDSLYDCETLEDFYGRLAHLLALKVRYRGRKGFYRSYLGRTERLSHLSGRLDVTDRIKRPWDVTLKCSYEENTVDLEENQILVWTLHAIAKSGLCTDQVLPTVRQAYRELQHAVSLVPFCGRDCVSRLYNRLNDDYEPMHAICRFFLEHTGPALGVGDHAMLPFLVDMDRLFELFVVEFMKKHLPSEYDLQPKEKVYITDDGSLKFEIDLVLSSSITGEPLCVLDTKYKRPNSPSTADIEQVTTYAYSKGCSKAFLIYPAFLPTKQEIKVNDISIHCATFSLEDDLEIAGKQFLDNLMAACSN
jgi:5-methylcytosine-specific restriction enzyme subunit McrC